MQLKQLNDMIRLGSMVFAMLLMAACGFQLRGAYQLPQAMSSTYIESASQSELVTELARSLQNSGIEVLSQPVETAAILKLHNEQKSRRVVSVDARGRAREYTLIYALRFSVKNASAGFSLDDQTLSIERDFLFDPEDVLGNSRGQDELYADMRQDLVRLVMLRLQSRAGR